MLPADGERVAVDIVTTRRGSECATTEPGQLDGEVTVSIEDLDVGHDPEVRSLDEAHFAPRPVPDWTVHPNPFESLG